MGCQIYSRTTITGSEKAIKQVEALISDREALEAKFPCVETFGLPDVSVVPYSGHDPVGYIKVVFDSRKEVPEELFAWCESLGCHVFALSNCEGDNDEEHYDTECIVEDREEKLAMLEARLTTEKEQLAEAQAEEEMGTGVQGNSNGSAAFSGAAMAEAMVQVTEDSIAKLRTQIAGDIWRQALED